MGKKESNTKNKNQINIKNQEVPQKKRSTGQSDWMNQFFYFLFPGGENNHGFTKLKEGYSASHTLFPIRLTLLLELFTRDGCGTLISSDPFESISSATLDDIPGILEMSLGGRSPDQDDPPGCFGVEISKE